MKNVVLVALIIALAASAEWHGYENVELVREIRRWPIVKFRDGPVTCYMVPGAFAGNLALSCLQVK